ncbi:nitroreductase family protein [Ktedonosporobacter rubrisoli]|uniref:Nitroreductase family protein n=1 Tax=Ktedonosporobacter rubrisoli TaxID=2509675 RepID=A0A4P6JXU3_KTERU|nr:nitroreductase family protein [Ktedonosporobacter rubrisoli]QBD80589.1 nitroreductase family protein [Ktedonosporobacter rubrisoli]
MPILNLSVDELLTTTRSVRKRLDRTRPVEAEVLRECLELALQAPTTSSGKKAHFVVVTASSQREALAALYRRSAANYIQRRDQIQAAITDEKEAKKLAASFASAQYLIEHLHEIPVHVIACIEGRAVNLSAVEEATHWSAILPAVWSFMLAARSRGLGTVLTTLHLDFEQEAAEVLNIPYEQIMQVALIPVAYTLGTNFKPAARQPLESVLHWDCW